MVNKKYWYGLLILVIPFISGCNNEQKPVVIAPVVPQKPAIMAPFRFHKLVEVSPGQYYDVLSWGRGASKVGSFLILHSDSSGKKYTTTTGDLNGGITDAFNTDMDLDGNPEIIIEAKGADTLNYVNIYAFEFTGGRAQKIEFPKLSKAQKEGYRGNDNFYVKDGQLYREFPLFNGTGKEAEPGGQKRLLLYGLRDNNFTVKQLSKDSVSADKNKPAVTAPAVKATKVKATKKRTIEKKHRKRKRHHSSEE